MTGRRHFGSFTPSAAQPSPSSTSPGRPYQRPVAPGPVDDDLPDHDAATIEPLFSRPTPDWSDRAAVAEFAAGLQVLVLAADGRIERDYTFVGP